MTFEADLVSQAYAEVPGDFSPEEQVPVLSVTIWRADRNRQGAYRGGPRNVNLP